MMKKQLIINVETHFLEYDGKIYAESLMDPLYWQKYLNVFDELYVLVRLKQYNGEDLSKWILSSYDHVHFLELPNYRGPIGYAKNYFSIQRCMKKYIQDNQDLSCAIIRSPSPLGYQFLKKWRKTGKPYGLEMVANLSDEFYYSIDFIHSILYKRLHLSTKKFAKKADGVIYVTRNVLQKEYPTEGIQASCSDIDLPKELYYKRPELNSKKSKWIMIHVSTLELDVKGNEEFFQVQRRLLDDGYDVESVIVGGGRYLQHYKERAKELGLDNRTRFTGHLSRKTDVMKELQQADLFLFPTLSEGLPRTVIEAMASSLPCVASDIPSLRELIDEEWLCAPKDVMGFVNKIKQLIDDPGAYNSVAKRNYDVACEYEYEELNRRRSEFYKMICQ